jgi:microcystin-dependent protein
MSYQSKYTGQEIDERLSRLDNTEQLDSVFCRIQTTSTAPVKGSTLKLNVISGNMTVNEDRIVIKPGKRVQIDITLCYMDNISGYGNTEFTLRDFTNDIDIHKIKPYQGNTTYEQPLSLSAQYTNTTDKDCEIGLVTTVVDTRCNIYEMYTSFTVHEIGKVITTNQGSGNPVGTIISLMRKTAPEGYLICDGRELNIADYPALSTMFEEEFGSKNIYGGDGITTFAVPDLRNEFLRGYGELSNEIGVHQDATSMPYFWLYRGGASSYTATVNANADDHTQCNNTDTEYHNTDNKRRFVNISGGSLNKVDGSMAYAYTSRPTNVAVLYCIKY